jgi:CRISPR locus-related DNA-binding protein
MAEVLDALIMTLGFEPGPLIRAVASYNLKTGASIIVFTPTFKDDRTERAYLELKKVCGMIFKDTQVSLQEVAVDLTNFIEAVKYVRALLSKFTDKHVGICLSGGMRALCLAVYTAYLMLEWQYNPIVEVHLEGRAERLIIPPIHKIVKAEISEEKLNILRLLSQYKQLSIGDIANLMQKDRSTVYRHVQSLFRNGFVKQKGRIYELTELGIMLT